MQGVLPLKVSIFSTGLRRTESFAVWMGRIAVELKLTEMATRASLSSPDIEKKKKETILQRRS